DDRCPTPARNPLPAHPGTAEGRRRRRGGRARGGDPRQQGRPARAARADRPGAPGGRGAGRGRPLLRGGRAALRPVGNAGPQALADGGAPRAGEARPLHVRL
ncbi:MAG: hypothetical protein AVDCRST_MAG01-01-2758, partial [uncultured Rubrobacteraceae bacterium]